MDGTPGGSQPPDQVCTRPVEGTDVHDLVTLHRGLSADTLRCRFLTSHPDLSAERIGRLVDVDGHDRSAVVALRGGRVVGIAHYGCQAGGAEGLVTLLVADDERDDDLEVRLLRELAAVARPCGVRRLVLEVHPLDRRLLGALEASDLRSTWHLHAGAIEITLPLDRPDRPDRPDPPATGADRARGSRSAPRS
ncbi:MAG TPA: hypothetical protein VF743_06460, partial [Acidimicrobiales bacterium]